MTAKNQTVEVVTSTESEDSQLTQSMKLSWFTMLVANVSVKNFPDVETPLVADIVSAFLDELRANSGKLVKGGLLADYGIDLRDLNNLLRFLGEDRVKVEGVVLRSST
jgi:hypothetical protein